MIYANLKYHPYYSSGDSLSILFYLFIEIYEEPKYSPGIGLKALFFVAAVLIAPGYPSESWPVGVANCGVYSKLMEIPAEKDNSSHSLFYNEHFKKWLLY